MATNQKSTTEGINKVAGILCVKWHIRKCVRKNLFNVRDSDNREIKR